MATNYDNFEAAGALTGTEVIPLGQGSKMVKTTAQAIANLGGGGGGQKLMLNIFNPSGGTVANGGTNYIGAGRTIGTVANINKIYFTESFTITKASLTANTAVGQGGTDEAWSVYIRLNNTTDYLISTLGVAADSRHFFNNAMTVPIVSGDYIEIKMVNPTWISAPGGPIFTGYLILI